MTKTFYLQNPCRASSLPYWKTQSVIVPDFMRIVHDTDFCAGLLKQYQDEPYFRLLHTLESVESAQLPEYFSLCEISIPVFSEHINRCYSDLYISADDLQAYTRHAVYDPTLWIAVFDKTTGEIAATGIAELDREIGEGILEWIQVSKEYRGRGLGKFVVLTLLERMRGKAEFATVSGKCRNPTNPEMLYRRCGFIGNDVWHILTKR